MAQLIPAASALMVHNLNGKILFVRSRTTGEKWGFPGGHVDFNRDKTPRETAIREAKEETALDIGIERLLGVYITSEYNPNFRISCFISRSEKDEVKPNYEITDWQWISPEDALKLDLTKTAHQALEDFLNRKEVKRWSIPTAMVG